ncbi:MAG: heat-inducible transcriptional repressor HrcA [Bacilli bacterium]|nr:heat-inducible transcriptional repressor HrcA [Bacilli bacterium]
MNRRDKVLKLIVEHFIKNAQPVGSKTLIEEYGLDYSSATIRSEMNALEQDGYLEKTHTSSGRVPSSKGYKYYIEHLRDRSIDEEFKYQMQTVLDQKVKSIQDVITQSCEILSQMTNLASIVLGPGAKEEHLVSVQLVPISNTSATCVFVTDQGYVENKTFRIDENTKLSDVEECIKLLNDRLKGTSIAELVPKMEAIRPLIDDYVINHDVIYQAMLEAFVGFAKDRLSAFGQEELFDQPEFANDAMKMKKLLELFNSPEAFREVEESDDEGISIRIGDDDEDVSIVQAKIKVPGSNERSIAVVGPKRMDYDKVVSSLEYLMELLDEYYDESPRKEAKGEREERKQTFQGRENSHGSGKAKK